MDKENKTKKIGTIISTVGILSVIIVAMIGYVDINGFAREFGGAIYYNFIEVENKSIPLNKRIDIAKTRIEDGANEIFMQNEYKNINTQIDLLLGDEVLSVSNHDIVLLDNEYLSFIYDNEDITDKRLDYLFDVQEKIKKSNPNTQMIYVQAPFKVNKYDNSLPYYVTETTNYLLDKLLEGLDGKMDYLDLRQSMYDQEINQLDYFYKTDHHWTAEGGVWATNEISKTLERNYGFETNYDYLNLDNYKIDVYKDVFLGSEGKIVGDGLTGKDDLSLIYPKFETDFTFEIRGYNIIKNGTFEETIFDYDYLHIHDGKDMVYLGGHHANAIIKNNSVNNGKKILIVKDSFVNVVAPYLVLNYEQIDLIDLRMYDRMTIDEYVKATNPDLVMFLYTETPLAGFD